MPILSQRHSRDTFAAWSKASRLLEVRPFSAAIHWIASHRRRWIRRGELPTFRRSRRVIDTWLSTCIGPLVEQLFESRRAITSVVTVVDWNDDGIRLVSGAADAWRSFTRDEWERQRTAWLLVSGCGEAHTATVTFLVQPYQDMKGWESVHDLVARAPAWTERAPSLVFRGATTGVAGFDETNVFDNLPRAHILSRLRASGLPADVGFIRVCQTAPDREAAVKKTLAARGLITERLPLDLLLGHRYQLMIDGNHGAWSAHAWKLISGSTCLFRSNATNWYDAFFEPWVHYVPVSPDGSDVVCQLRRVLEDTSLARELANACARRAAQVFRLGFMWEVQKRQWLELWDELAAGLVGATRSEPAVVRAAAPGLS